MCLRKAGSHGLLPEPREIFVGCSCPDGARMGKHVAARKAK
jgi:uncharacterized Zn finger protein